MIFHENCLLAGNSHEISYLIFFQKIGKMSENLSSAAVVIGALRVKLRKYLSVYFIYTFDSFAFNLVYFKKIIISSFIVSS